MNARFRRLWQITQFLLAQALHQRVAWLLAVAAVVAFPDIALFIPFKL